LNSGGTDTRLFRKFIAGLERRMGRFVRQNSGIAIDVLLKVFENYERELSWSSLTKERSREIIMAGAGFACLFCAALREGELLLVEASELCRRIREGKSHPKHPFVVVPLMGRFKGENGERNLMFLLANRTKRGIEMRRWLERLS